MPLTTHNPQLTTLFNATSFAVIGASRDPQKVGYQILRNLKENPDLKIFPVNPNTPHILGLRCVPSLLQIEDQVEVAIIAVPIQFVESVVDDCISKKVKAVVMITAGFAELSTTGKKLQQRLADQLREAGITLLGPNSLGFIAPRQKINASFANKEIQTGSIALISQSGAMLTALFDEMSSQDIGCSFAMSLGNKSGITEIDALQYAANDPHTTIIGVYLESFSDIPNFFKLCSEISKHKPILLIKGGRSKQGQIASISHTAALATNFELLKAAQSQAGFVIVDSIEAFVHCLFFLHDHRSTPSNVMVLTNAGGPGVNTTDLIAQKDISLAQWSKNSTTQIIEEYPSLHPANPLDLLGDAQTDRFQFAIRQAQRDPNVDAILLIITQQSVTHIPEIVEMLIKEKGKKPLLVSLIGGEQLEKFRKQLRSVKITCTEFPNQLVDILGITKQIDNAKYIPTKFSPIHNNLTTQQHNNFTYTIDQAFSLLNQYHFQIPRYVIARSEKDIKHFIYPLYAKTANLTLKHKKKIGGVAGMVENDDEAGVAYKKLSQFGNAVLYQELVQANGELLLGATRDPQFGWYIAFGLGGGDTDILQDRAYIFPHATVEHITTVFKTTKAYALLKKLEEQNGDKGSVKQFVNCIVNLQKLIKDNPEISEIEINPVMVNPQGFWAADVKISM